MDCPIFLGASPRAGGMRKAERDGASRGRAQNQQILTRGRIPPLPPEADRRAGKMG